MSRFHGRRIVHAIARHRDDLTVAFQGLDQPQLLLRPDARENAAGLDRLREGRIVEPVNVVARNYPLGIDTACPAMARAVAG